MGKNDLDKLVKQYLDLREKGESEVDALKRVIEDAYDLGDEQGFDDGYDEGFAVAKDECDEEA